MIKINLQLDITEVNTLINVLNNKICRNVVSIHRMVPNIRTEEDEWQRDEIEKENKELSKLCWKLESIVKA